MKLIFVLIVFGSLLITGYYQYIGNQSIQIPLVQKINDPSLYANDVFAQTLSRYSTFLWYVVAFLARIIPLPILLLMLFLLERFLLIYSGRFLARAFFDYNVLAEIGAMIWLGLAPSPMLGAGSIALTYFEQTGLSIPFFLMALASFYKKKPWHWAIFLSVGFYLNIMYGFYTMFYCLPFLILDKELRIEIKKWVKAFVLFFVLSLPIIIFTIHSYSIKAIDNQLWLAVARVRFSAHLFPQTWSYKSLLKFLVLVVFIAGIYWQKRKKHSKLAFYSMFWCMISLFWIFLAFLAAKLQIPGLLVMHPARGTDIWYVIAFVSLISLFAKSMDTQEIEQKTLNALAFIGAVFFFYFRLNPQFSVALIFMGLIFLGWPFLLKVDLLKKLPICLALITIGFFGFIGFKRYLSRYDLTTSYKAAIAPSINPELADVANWAKKNSAKDSVFLVNPVLDQFRPLSQRAVFITWKDASAILWERTFVAAFYKRMCALGMDPLVPSFKEVKPWARIDEIYKEISAKDISELKIKYRIDYWVTASDNNYIYPVAFSNKDFKVFKIE
ncbi:MAG: hypothetical protein MUO31_08480 [Thermodesulfovibrionales bacterium]|nr:hypothetical protein [Thermodesulfovibrionales bacterium]